MTSLRMCFVTTFYPPFHFGGDAMGVQRLAQAFARRGHEVLVVHDADAFAVLGGAAAARDAVDPAGVRVVTLRTRLPLVSTLLTQQTGGPVMNHRRLRDILAPGRFDVVWFNNISLVGGPRLLAYGEGAVRIYLAHEHWLICPTHVLWRHGRELCDGRECIRCQVRYHRPPQWWRHTGLLERYLPFVDEFVAMSEFSRRKHAEFGFPRAMTVLPYFLPELPASRTSGSGLPHPRPYFLFVGRLERIKGLQDVIPHFEGPDGADLLVAGDGDHAPALRRLAEGHPRVRFLGRLEPDALDQLYRHALALIVPSLCYETFGIVLLEAFRHAVPVIARRLGPFPEIVEASSGGLLFETDAELAAVLRVMENEHERRAEMGRASLAAFRARWREEVVVPQYLDLIATVRARRCQSQRPEPPASARVSARATAAETACERS